MIEVRGLNKSFQDNPVLKGIDLGITVGERVALIGHNGSGKSTFVRCLLGLHNFSGEIRINGKCPRADRLDVLSRSAFVPQLPPALRGTCQEYVTLAHKVCQGRLAQIQEIAQTLGLPWNDMIRRPFAKLSGGMKQKLLIAIAFARDVNLLVLDEPTASLDPTARLVFSQMLDSLPSSTTVLVVSHRLEDLDRQIGRVLRFDHGSVVEDQMGVKV